VVYARGRYLALLDGDDRWMPDYLEAQLEILETDRTIDVLSANMINQGGRWDGKPFHTGTNGPIRRITLLDLIEREDAVCIMTVFRRAVIDRVGGFDSSVQYNEDYDYWLRAAVAGCSIAFNPRPLGYYRRSAGSKSADEQAALVRIVDVLRN